MTGARGELKSTDSKQAVFLSDKEINIRTPVRHLFIMKQYPPPPFSGAFKPERFYVVGMQHQGNVAVPFKQHTQPAKIGMLKNEVGKFLFPDNIFHPYK